MSIIQAYKSDADGKIFEDKKKYLAHLRKLAAARRQEEKRKKLEQEFDTFMHQMGQVKSIDELNQFIKDNWKMFWQNGANHEHWHWNKKGVPDFHEFVDVGLLDMRWGEKISNSHSCPRGGVQNFDTRSKYNIGKPTGYPGWVGRIIIKVRPPMYKRGGKEYLHDGWGSSYFEGTTIKTGSGGGGSTHDKDGIKYISYSYDVKLFAADFPVMHEIVRREQYVHRENERRQQIWRTLGGTGQPTRITEIPEDWVCPDPFTVEDENARVMW